MKFNIRVYGVLINSQNQVLLSDEFIRGQYITKFPGGGLEFGEGTRDCLQREFMEETGLEVTVEEHIYTTDFYQLSAFRQNEQIISIYYKVKTVEPINLVTHTTLFNFTPEQVADPQGEAEVFRWVDLKVLESEDLTLPIDKLVVQILKTENSI